VKDFFNLRRFFDIRWNCERPGTPIDEPTRLNCATSEETFSKTEQSLSMMLLTCCKFNLGQFRAFRKKIYHASHCRQIRFPPAESGEKQKIVPAWTENLMRGMKETEILSKIFICWKASLQYVSEPRQHQQRRHYLRKIGGTTCSVTYTALSGNAWDGSERAELAT
jgi:hypothetical protein